MCNNLLPARSRPVISLRLTNNPALLLVRTCANRRLRHVDFAPGTVATPHAFTREECDSIANVGRAQLVHGNASVVVDAKHLQHSPYLGTCCLPRWHGADADDVDAAAGSGSGGASGDREVPSLTIAVPYESPNDFHDDSRVLEMLVGFLTTGALHEKLSDGAVPDPSCLLELACVAHSVLLPDLQQACENRIAAVLDGHLYLLPRAFDVAVSIDAGPLMHCCAELVVANLETLIETKRLERLPLRALEGVTAYYHASFTRLPRYSLTLNLPSRPKSGGSSGMEMRGGDVRMSAALTSAELWRLPMVPPVALSSSPRSNRSGGSDPGTGYVQALTITPVLFGIAS